MIARIGENEVGFSIWIKKAALDTGKTQDP